MVIFEKKFKKKFREILPVGGVWQPRVVLVADGGVLGLKIYFIGENLKKQAKLIFLGLDRKKN